MNKLSLALCIAIIGMLIKTPLCGKELFSAGDVKDFVSNSGISSNGEKILILQGKFQSSAKIFSYDSQKKYKLSCSVRLVNGSKGKIWLGFIPFDADGKKIACREINLISKSLTKLAGAAEKGSTELVLVDGSAWNNKTPYGYVAFNAKTDFSDLPNRSCIPMAKGSVVKENEVWKVKLSKPLEQDYPAGTEVRQHVDSDKYIYCVRPNLTEENQPISAVISGHAEFGLSYKKAWRGTARIQVLIGFTSPDTAAIMELSELKLEELP